MIMDVEFNESKSTFSVEMSEGGGGTAGQDGFSPIANVTQTDEGAIIEITDASGTTVATVSHGQDGYTPVRGTDYWTEADKVEIINEVGENIDISGLEKRVATNEEAIASAFHFIPLFEQQITDHENRISTNEDVIGQNVSRIIDLENRTTEIENELATYGDFELIESVELTNDVVNVTPNIEQNYNELYMVFTIPTVNSDGSNTDKCRIRCYANDNKDFLIQGAAYVENYKEEWKLFIHAKFIANYIKGDIFHITSKTNKMGYIVAPSSNTQNGVVQPGFEMNEDYFNNLTIKMFDANGKQILRCFPVGTKYKLWGVKK